MPISSDKKMESPGRIRNMLNSQSLGRKLGGVALASLVPVVVLGSLLVSDKLSDIKFTQQEITGVDHLEAAWPMLLEHIYTEESDHKTAGHDHDETAVKNFIEFAKAKSGELQAQRTAELVINTIENDPHLVIPSGLQHLTAIVNNSKLILDPELSSIYLVLATGIELPRTLEALSALEMAVDKVVDSKSGATPDKSQIFVAKYKTVQSAESVVEHVETALRSITSEELRAILEPELKNFKAKSEELNSLISQAGGTQINYMLLAKSAVQSKTAIESVSKSADSLWKASSVSLRKILVEREAKLRTTLYFAAAAFGLLLLVSGFGLYLISRSISRPIATLIGKMWQLRDGNTSFETPFIALKNDVGDIARAVEASRLNAADLQKARSEIDLKLGEETNRNADTRSFLTDIGNVVQAAGEGKFDDRLQVAGRKGFLLDLSNNINSLLENVQSGISGTSRIVKSLASGDLENKMEGNHKGIFLELMHDVNALADKFRGIAAQIGKSTQAVQGATREIGVGVTDLSGRTEQQASSLEETAASMEEIAATVRQNADNAQEANQLASAARQLAVSGGEITARAVTAMDKIESSSREVSDIVGVIQEIAFQTNILALNAAVEAARAGEAGRGFAVVANEVRALAQRSAQASKDIKDLIAGTTDSVAEGADLVKHAGSSLTEIVTSVRKVADIVSEIAAASQEQSSGIDQVSRAVTNMDEMTQQNAALVEETNAALHSAQEQVEELKQAVSFFKMQHDIEGHSIPKQGNFASGKEEKPKSPDSLSLQDKLRQLATKMLNAQNPKHTAVPTNAQPAKKIVANADWKEF
jgi:methyl-accepting chemotaxis protein